MAIKEYSNVRKGLLIIIGSVILLILFLIMGRFIGAIAKSESLILFLISIVELVGVIFCALDKEKNFKYAIIVLACSIVIGILGAILYLIPFNEINPTNISGLVLIAIGTAFYIFASFFILRGCIVITEDRTVRLGTYFSISLIAFASVFYVILLFLDYFNAFPIGGRLMHDLSVVYFVLDVFADLLFIFTIVKTYFDFSRA